MQSVDSETLNCGSMGVKVDSEQLEEDKNGGTETRGN